MPNWLQLVEFTAEHTPGVWYPVVTTRGRDGALESADVVTTVREQKRAVAGCYGAGLLIMSEYSDVGAEREVVANARLIADAPQMLVALASVLNAYDMADRFPAVARELIAQHKALIETIMRRHVNIGCAPVDAESRAELPHVSIGDDVRRSGPRTEK